MRDTKTLLDNLKDGIAKYKKETGEDLFAVTIPVVDIIPKLERLVELEANEEPAKPIFVHTLSGWIAGFKCPRCGSWFVKDYRYADMFYCQKCGAKLKLEDEDE